MEDFIPQNIPPERQAILREAWKRRRQKLASRTLEERMKRFEEAKIKGEMPLELEKELAERWGWNVDAGKSQNVPRT
jgi:hypothetical protein